VDSCLCDPALERGKQSVCQILFLRLVGQQAQPIDPADAGRGCRQYRPDDPAVRLGDDGKRVRCTQEFD